MGMEKGCLLWHKFFSHKELKPTKGTALMSTECTQKSFGFHQHYQRRVEANFDGGTITSNGGAVLLREVERETRMLADWPVLRRPARPRFDRARVAEMTSQRVLGLALGYEDLNDHDDLCRDPLLAMVAGKKDVEGKTRRRKKDRGKALAGKSTLNRMELSGEKVGEGERYKKIFLRQREGRPAAPRTLFMEAQEEVPEDVILDLDATDDPVHGNRKADSFMATTALLLPAAVHLCGTPCVCVRGCDRRTSTLRRAPWRRSSGSWLNCGNAGPRCRSSCGPTAAFAVTRSWPGR